MEQKVSEEVRLRHWILLLILGGIWGSSFVLMKLGLKAMTPIEVATWRNASALLVSCPFLFAGLRNIKIRDWKFVIVAAYFGSGFPAILYSISSMHVESSINGILNGLTPLFTLVFGVYLFKNNSLKNKYLGVLVGFVGASLLVLTRSGAAFKSQSFYILLPILAASFYGISGNTVKKYLNQYNSFQVTSMLYFFLGIPAFAYLFFNNSFASVHLENIPLCFWRDFDNPEIQRSASFAAVFVLGAMGTAIANFGFYYLIQKTTVLFGSMTTYIIPAVAMFWGYVDGEALGLFHFLSLSLILLGVWIVGKGK